MGKIAGQTTSMYRTTEKYRKKNNNIRANDAFARKIMRPEILVSANILLFTHFDVTTFTRGTKPKATRYGRQRECPECVRDWIDLYRTLKHVVFLFLSTRTTNMLFYIQLWTFTHSGPRSYIGALKCVSILRWFPAFSFAISTKWLYTYVSVTFGFRCWMWKGVRLCWVVVIRDNLPSTGFNCAFSCIQFRAKWTFSSNKLLQFSIPSIFFVFLISISLK